MSKMHNKALSILTPDEKSAVTLQHVHGKSSWEAGEMLNKSHYKYLEIKYRAEKFLKLFSEHFALYEELIPEDIEMDEGVRKYLLNAIEKRLKVKEAATKTGETGMMDNQTREARIIASMGELRDSTDITYINTYSMIMEFDRYNNFRIMPRQIQEPSAFKRRNSTRYKKHLKIATSIPLYSLKRLRELFEVKKAPLKNEGFLVLINKEHSDNCGIIRVNAKPDNLIFMTNLSLYVFNSKIEAQEFADTVIDYISQVVKAPKEGLKFWPAFRNLIKKAANHDTINNIAPTRRSVEIAMKDMDTYYSSIRNRTKYNKELNKY